MLFYCYFPKPQTTTWISWDPSSLKTIAVDFTDEVPFCDLRCQIDFHTCDDQMKPFRSHHGTSIFVFVIISSCLANDEPMLLLHSYWQRATPYNSRSRWLRHFKSDLIALSNVVSAHYHVRSCRIVWLCPILQLHASVCCIYQRDTHAKLFGPMEWIVVW